MKLALFTIIATLFLVNAVLAVDSSLEASTHDLTLVVGSHAQVELVARNYTRDNATLTLSQTDRALIPHYLTLVNGSATVNVTALKPTSKLLVEVQNCTENESNCTIDLSEAFFRLTIVKSNFINVLVEIVGWGYFFAWSISFYPQILLNIQRKSVIGLNFDFLLLNIIGFGAYSIYNLLMYFDPYVISLYHLNNPRTPQPVLANDVVFAVHAFFASLFTAFQCLIYERENQKISNKCYGLTSLLVTFGVGSALTAAVGWISVLELVKCLSYIKMAVTMSKYFPQAFFNYQRKSTVGWSIGNVLLDFTGGSLDILQMVLQAVNVDDWGAFSQNPVKFGLGLVSIIFDVIFIFQHYVLYRNPAGQDEYSGIENPEAQQENVSSPDYGSQARLEEDN